MSEISKIKAEPLNGLAVTNNMPGIIAAVVFAVIIVAAAVMAASAGNFLLATICVLALMFGGAAMWIFASQARRVSAMISGKIGWQNSLPEIQRQTLDIEVSELSRQLQIEPDQLGDVQSAYIVAEDLALRQIQSEEKTPLLRHVSIADSSFEAVMFKDGRLYCYDVSFLVTPEIRPDKIDAIKRKAAMVEKAVARADEALATRIVLVLITQLVAEDLARLRSSITKEKFDFDVDIRMLDFEKLQLAFVSE